MRRLRLRGGVSETRSELVRGGAQGRNGSIDPTALPPSQMEKWSSISSTAFSHLILRAVGEKGKAGWSSLFYERGNRPRERRDVLGIPELMGLD